MELRGFKRNTILPQAIRREPNLIPGTPNADGSSTTGIGGDEQFDVLQPYGRIGGNAKALAGVELIVPTPFMDEDKSSSVRTSLFVDVANVWDTEFDLGRYTELQRDQIAKLDDYSDPSRYRASAGLSVQWISPMGPMLISFAYPLKKEEDDDTETISFNISNTF